MEHLSGYFQSPNVQIQRCFTTEKFKTFLLKAGLPHDRHRVCLVHWTRVSILIFLATFYIFKQQTHHLPRVLRFAVTLGSALCRDRKEKYPSQQRFVGRRRVVPTVCVRGNSPMPWQQRTPHLVYSVAAHV